MPPMLVLVNNPKPDRRYFIAHNIIQHSIWTTSRPNLTYESPKWTRNYTEYEKFRLKRSLRNISPMPQLPSSSGNRFLRALRLVEMTKRKSSVEMTEEGVPFDTSSFHQKGWPGRDFAMQSRKGEKAKGFGDLPRNKRG